MQIFENDMGGINDVPVEVVSFRGDILYYAEGSYNILPISGRLGARSYSIKYVAVIKTSWRVA